MASIQRHGKKWRAQVAIAGRRASKCFNSKPEAMRWAILQEESLGADRLPEHSLRDAFEKFASEVSPTHESTEWEKSRLKFIASHWPMADCMLTALKPEDIARWRDLRLVTVKPGTVARDLNLLSAVLETARRDWYWLARNPMRDVRWPKTPKGRARRISADEEAAVVAAFGLADGLKADTLTKRVGLAFLLALETGMRAGEMLRLTWADIHLSEQYVHLRKTKNGDARDVPLSRRAVEILKTLPLQFGPAFGLKHSQRSALWQKVVRASGVKNLRFHDTRAEAIWRLSRKLKIMDLARAIGHRDLKSLMIYYNESASELARQLG